MSASAEAALELYGRAEPVEAQVPTPCDDLLSACKAAYKNLRTLNLDAEAQAVFIQLRSAILTAEPEWKP